MLATLIEFDFLPIAGIVLSIFTLVIAGYYAVRYVDSTGIKAQLDAKDAVIATNRQTIDAFEGRIEALESQIESLIEKLTTAQTTIDDLQRRLDESLLAYESLEQYAAPKAVLSIETKLDQILDKVNGKS